MSQAVSNRYHCPAEFLDFEISDQLSAGAGYFHFGPNVVCYGRTKNGTHRGRLHSILPDLLGEAATDDGRVLVPFDPDEIIGTLRLERYPLSHLGRTESALKAVYYWLRPLTGSWFRRQIQRLRAANWQERQFPCWPVDTTVEIVCESLLLLSIRAQGVDRVPFVWFWPHGADGCVVMTHDVETTRGRDFCSQLIDLDESFRIRASFQVVPEGRYAVAPEFLDRIRERGCEIGVQDLNHDGRLFDDREEFRRRAAAINRYGKQYRAAGFRAAVLYRRPEWYEDLDFSFDMSIPNVAHLDPQRGGCCTVMPYFIGNLLELPLTTVQDYMLFHLLNERSIDLWKTQVEMILAKNGLASFIVHPDYIIERDTRLVYESLLRWLCELRGRRAVWFALPREIDAWWRARSQMSVVRDGEGWRIEGHGAERAVLAFAKEEGGRLVYERANGK